MALRGEGIFSSFVHHMYLILCVCKIIIMKEKKKKKKTKKVGEMFLTTYL